MNQKGRGALKTARQGHRYHLNGKNVLALESGLKVKVLYFDPAEPWNHKVSKAFATQLIPQPMRYYHGQIP